LTNRWDETWHRLLEWTNGQPPSERLAAQIMLHEGYTNFDPSHPLGGRDGTKDATCQKDGQRWVMAVYFPRGQKSFNDIEEKFLNDLKGVQSNKVDAIAFVTNQELRLAEREVLRQAAGAVPVELFHLEKITAILDKPEMYGVRKQFLGIDNEAIPVSLGGEGGKAPGAGGGGGGAFGSDAYGGGGGSGGNIFFLDGQSAEVPGAGGGGGGAVGEAAVGGAGGGGGEHIECWGKVEDLPGRILEINLGRAGRGTEYGDGEDGEDSVINVLKDDGSKVELLRAKGGKGGRSGWTLKRPQQQAAMESSSDRLWISSALLANYAEIRDGLIHTIGCGWDSYTVHSLPCYLGGYFVFVIELGETTVGCKYELLVRFLDADSLVIGQVAVAVEKNNSSRVVRHSMTIPFQIEVTTPGIWTAQVLLGNDELVGVPFDIRQSS
jgi:hypothetical protein